MTTGYRSPLRIQWERDRKRFERQAQGFDDHAVIARALLAFMPALVDFMEGELQRGTRPLMTLEAVTAAITNMAFQVISATVDKGEQHNALKIMHQLLEGDVRPRIDRGATSGQIILPERMH